MEIVSLAPSNTEILFSLGAEDEVVATTSLCDFPDEATDLPGVGGWTSLDYDKVENINPDLALTSDDLQDRIVEELEKRGIEVRQFKPYYLEEVKNSFIEIGDIVGRKERAEEMAKNLEQKVSSADLSGARIYCEEWMDPPMISGNWVPGLIQAAGGDYMIEEGERSRKFDLDELREFDPEIIVLNVCGAGENINIRKVARRDGWEDISAVENENIFVVDDAFLNRPGPRLAEGVSRIEELVVENLRS